MMVGRQACPFGALSIFKGKLAVKLWGCVPIIGIHFIHNFHSPHQLIVPVPFWRGSYLWSFPGGKKTLDFLCGITPQNSGWEPHPVRLQDTKTARKWTPAAAAWPGDFLHQTWNMLLGNLFFSWIPSRSLTYMEPETIGDSFRKHHFLVPC